MARRNNSDFTQRTRKVLAKRVGEICSNPECSRVTSGPHSDEDQCTDIGEAAHITAKAPGAARCDASLTPQQRRHPSNGVWLCGPCHEMIDQDEAKYPVELLIQWKNKAEIAQEQRLQNRSKSEDRQSFWLSEIEWADEFLDDHLPKSCIAFLERIQAKVWDQASIVRSVT